MSAVIEGLQLVLGHLVIDASLIAVSVAVLSMVHGRAYESFCFDGPRGAKDLGGRS